MSIYQERDGFYIIDVEDGTRHIGKTSEAGLRILHNPNHSIVPYVEPEDVVRQNSDLAIDNEALERIRLEIPSITSLQQLVILEEILPEAMSPKLLKVKNIRAVASGARLASKGKTKEEVKLQDPKVDIIWP